MTDADENLAEFDNVDLIEGSVEDVLDEIDGAYDAAVIDPPRSGVDAAALDALAEIGPRTIVYVSCEPATLARDAKRLAAHGYRLGGRYAGRYVPADVPHRVRGAFRAPELARALESFSRINPSPSGDAVGEFIPHP